jgi:transcription termination factor Rho
MPVLDRSELEASPLADLHAIADQVGLEGFRRMRKAALVNAILGEDPPEPGEPESGGEDEPEESPAPRRRRPRRSPAAATAESEDREEDTSERPARRGRSRGGRSSSSSGSGSGSSSSSSSSRERAPRSTESAEDSDGARTAEGDVEVLGNGSAFLRIDPPEPSDNDVYISAAQVRRCELVTGDRVSGPVRTPRRSERYPSLIRIDTINGASADAVSDGSRYEDLPVAWPSERLAFDAEDPTLKAIEWLAPIGLGSRVVIVGASQSGKTETLRRVLECLRTREDLEISLVLAGARPEEISQWGEGAVQPAAALSFAASSETQGQAIERALDAAKRVASRGGNALVLIDGLEYLGQHVARKALAAARNLHEGGSLTLIATAPAPLGGETTVIALDRALTSSGREPIIDLMASGTLRPELLVGEDGAKAIAKARATALEDQS